MGKPSNWIAFVLAALLLAPALAGCAGRPATATQRSAPTIALTPCQIGRPDSSERMAAKCGTMNVYEDRAAAQGRQISLRVAVIPAISRNPAGDPLFFITGGPGGAATEDYLALAGAFRRINEKRDVVLVDQRGTGGSHPLACPSSEGAASDQAWADACLQQLDADPRFYTTLQAIGDLDDVRAGLGYEQVNLYGLSYGTRVAQSYLRAYPGRVRSVILDGVVPQDEALGLTMSSDAQHALDLTFARCAADQACREAFPNVRDEFAQLLAQVDREPVKLNLAHPTTGLPTELTFDRRQLGVAVRLFSYQPETVALLPMLIHDAATTGDLNRLAAQSLIVAQQLEGTMKLGMHNSVVCAEDVPFYLSNGQLATDAEAERRGYLGEAYRSLQEVCGRWPAIPAPAEYKQPVVSDVPVLLLSGEADPVTPPANAERVAATLSHSRHVVAPGSGHGVLLRGCTWRVATDFIERGSVDGLQTACITQIQPYPFFTSNAGPG